jgi:hypothetical protein
MQILWGWLSGMEMDLYKSQISDGNFTSLGFGQNILVPMVI